MPRARYTPSSLKRRKKVLKLAKGGRGGRSKLYRTALETIRRGMLYAYRDRRVRKREFRQLWILRINAAGRSCGITYSRFMYGLKAAGITVNRKMLSEIAVYDSKAFEDLVKIAREQNA